MKKSFAICTLLLCSLIALSLQTSSATTERRVALVVGNSNYSVRSLNLINPHNDADDVSAALRGLGFDVLEVTDADLSHETKALQQFAHMATDAETALFFYAGHALQYQGQNYLMPVDADIKDERDIAFETIGLDRVRTALDQASGVKIMVLDACRNNPVAEHLAGVGARGISTPPPAPAGERTRGVGRIDKAEGLIIAFSTGTGDEALDGQGRNSPYTTAFLKRLAEPGLEIETMFRRVASDVNIATNGRQRPETYVSLVDEYYLNQNDKLAWDRVKGTDDPAALRDFLARFPSSFYAIEAQFRLNALDRSIAVQKQRALQDAEEQRRSKEAAERQAAARLQSEKACLANRAALDAIGPRDVTGLRAFLAGSPCDAARSAAQARLADAEAQIAQAAEICRRDGAALSQLGTRDSAGIRELMSRTTCADVRTAAQTRLAAIQDELTKEAELCKRDNATLGAIGARDVGAMRDLMARTGCADVKAAVQARISVVEADMAREAEICRRDGTALDAIGARDLAGLRNLANRTACAGVKSSAQQKIATLEADLARQAEVCRREDAQVKALMKSGNRGAVESMRQTAQCPATTAAVDQAVREMAAAADAACARDNTALSTIGPRDADGLQRLIGRLSCETVKSSAQKRLADLEASLKHEADICRRDNAAWLAAQSGHQADIEALRGRIECPSIASAIDQKLAALKQTCGREKDAFAKIGKSDLPALRSFATGATCDDMKTLAQDRVAQVEAAQVREAAVCRADTDKMNALGPSSLRGDIEAVRRAATCPAVTAALDKRLAALQVVCGREGGALAKINDPQSLRGFLATTGCADLRADAQARLASLEATAAQQAETCRQDAARWDKLATSTDRRALEAARSDFRCPNVLATLDEKLASLRAVCASETAVLGKLPAGNVDGIKDMAAHASCGEVRDAARLRVATAEAEAARQEESCRRDELTFSSIQEKGADGRAEMVKFERGLRCDRLRPIVKAALEQLAPPEPVINSAAQIHAVQADLRRIGCLAPHAGKDGELDAETTTAMRVYLHRTGHGLKPKTPVRISDEVVASLGSRKERVCEPIVTARPEEPRRHRPEAVARRPEERQRPAPRERVVRERPREQRAPRELAERRPAPRAYQGATSSPSSSGGGGGHAGATLGVGF